jgi:hypothetical protein
MLTPDQALQTLARISMTTNTKIWDAADELVATGEPLQPGQR